MTKHPIDTANANLSWLKIAAITAMLWDHIAYAISIHNPTALNTWYIWARTPGRICMPIFAFLIAWNYRFNTRHPLAYVRRLALFAICCEPLYQYYFGYPGNAFIPLALGAWLAYYHDQQNNQPATRWIYTMCLSLTGAALIATLCHAPDILAQTLATWAISRYLLEPTKPKWLIAAGCCLPLFNGQTWQFYAAYAITIAAITAACTTNRKLTNAKLPKWLAYGFYPAHLITLSLIFGGA